MKNDDDIFNVMSMAKKNDKFSFVTEVDDQPDNSNNINQTSLDIFDRVADLNTEKENKKEDQKFSFLDTLKDVGQQIASKFASGVGGAFGNIFEAIGLQGSEPTKAEQSKYAKEFATLSKIKSGEKPTLAELMDLQSGDLPEASRLLTSKDIESDIEAATGVGEGKTPAGRIAGQGARFAGEGVGTGGGSAKTLAVLGASGLAGQSVRELGGPEELASGIEIAAPLLQGAVSKKLLPKAGSEAENIVNAGRKIGLSEKQITPLIQSPTKTNIVSKLARKGEKTQKLFGSIKEKFGDSYEAIKDSASAKTALPLSEKSVLKQKFVDISRDLEKTLAKSTDRKGALEFVNEAIDTLQKRAVVTPEHLISFWQDVNKSVDWNKISGGKKALTRLKKPVLEAMEQISPQLAKDFELTNKVASKYYEISKKLKPDLIDSFLNKAEVVSIGPSIIALAAGNPWAFSSLASESAVRYLATEMLTNPYFQNLSRKLVTNINQGSVKGATSIINQSKEYMQRKHPDEKWDFMTQAKPKQKKLQ